MVYSENPQYGSEYMLPLLKQDELFSKDSLQETLSEDLKK